MGNLCLLPAILAAQPESFRPLPASVYWVDTFFLYVTKVYESPRCFWKPRLQLQLHHRKIIFIYPVCCLPRLQFEIDPKFGLRRFDRLSQKWSRRPIIFTAGASCNVAAGQRRRAFEEQVEQPAEAAPKVLAHIEASLDSVSSQLTTTEEQNTKVASGRRPTTHAQGGCQKENRRHDVDDGTSSKLFGWLPFRSSPSRSS